MSIDLNTVSLPFDRWGTAASNKRVGERQTLTSVAWTEFNILIPKYAPYYSESIANDGIIHIPSGRRLVRGKDWIEGWYFQSASGEIGLDIHCCIYFYDPTLAGECEIESYQAMGGEWQINGQLLTQILAQKLLNPLRYYWEQIAELPEIFNPLDHDQDIEDFTKLGSLIDVLREIAVAIGKDDPAILAHIANKNNPHGTNKTHVGLPLVENWRPALVTDLVVGSLTYEAYMNPPMTYQLIQRTAIPAINAHAARVDNPHNTRADQTGAYFKAEVDALLESLARGLIHNLYAYRLEGKSVADIVAMARGDSAGSLDELRAAIAAANASANAHAQRTDNPHNTRADKTGAYFTTEVDALLDALAAGTLHNLYAFRLEGKSVNDIITASIAGVVDRMDEIKQDVLDTLTATLNNYKAVDTTKFAGKTEDQWVDIIDGKIVDAVNHWNIWPPGDVIGSETEASVILIAEMSDSEDSGGTDASHRGSFGFRVLMGGPNTTSPTNYADIFVSQSTGQAWGIASAALPTGVSFFLENKFGDDGSLWDGTKRLYMRAPAGFGAVDVTAFSMTGITVPGEQDIWKQSTWNGLGTPLATVNIALVTNGTKEMSDAVQGNVNTLTTAVTNLGTLAQNNATKILALENSNKVRYSQNRSIPAGNKVTIDMQTLVTDPADIAKYDYLGARVTVLLLDAVTGSDTKDSYIDSAQTVVKAIRGSRYLDLWNYDTVAATVAVRIELPLL
jgi:hypothetical protein